VTIQEDKLNYPSRCVRRSGKVNECGCSIESHPGETNCYQCKHDTSHNDNRGGRASMNGVIKERGCLRSKVRKEDR